MATVDDVRAVVFAAGLLVACASATPPSSTSHPPSSASLASTSASEGTSTSPSSAPPPKPLPTLLLSSEPTPPTKPNDPLAGLPPRDVRQPCVTDEDCWSITCCPAATAEQCVHHVYAQKCAIMDVTCPKLDVHFDCVCEESQCNGRTR